MEGFVYRHFKHACFAADISSFFRCRHMRVGALDVSFFTLKHLPIGAVAIFYRFSGHSLVGAADDRFSLSRDHTHWCDSSFFWTTFRTHVYDWQ